MKKQLNLIIMTLLAVVTLVSCSDSVTYADMKKKERNAINRYISNQKIQKISEAKFEEQGFTTDTTKNEYVLFESNGVYMQIVRKGEGASLNQARQPPYCVVSKSTTYSKVTRLYNSQTSCSTTGWWTR